MTSHLFSKLTMAAAAVAALSLGACHKAPSAEATTVTSDAAGAKDAATVVGDANADANKAAADAAAAAASAPVQDSAPATPPAAAAAPAAPAAPAK